MSSPSSSTTTRLAPQTGTGFILRAGQELTVIDPTGGQVSDLFCLAAGEHGEWLSSGRTIDYANSIYVTTGDILYSNRSRPMLTIVEDTCGAIALAPAEFWVHVNEERGVANMQAAFASVFGQGLWTIAGSLTAFVIGQLVDVAIFHRIRRATGERWIWLRATGSTAISQLIDSYVVLYIAFVIGPQQWPTSLFLAVGTVNYGYKLLMALLLIPLIYLTRRAIESYLGREHAFELREQAAS